MAKMTGCHRLTLVRPFLPEFAPKLIFVVGFNQIDLPQYSSYEMLRQQLLLAINEGGEGFAFS